jgi:Na+-transporting methylmalonyl-CoA/oxaloacetate decarboxylase gamma subunit
MAIDWGLAGQIGGVGFGMVFALLIVLAVVVWLTGLAVIRAGKDESSDRKGGD